MILYRKLWGIKPYAKYYYKILRDIEVSFPQIF